MERIAVEFGQKNFENESDSFGQLNLDLKLKIEIDLTVTKHPKKIKKSVTDTKP